MKAIDPLAGAPSATRPEKVTLLGRLFGPRSLWRYSPAAILVAVLVADSNRHTDPDLWGHIRFGQAFLAQWHLIRHDPYSYSALGHPWRDHEWLAEVVMALIYNAAGVVGLKLWKFTCTALTVFFIADTESQSGAPFSTQLAILLAASVALILQMQFRPQMFTFVLLSALLALLARDNQRRGRTASLWLAVPMMALWANLHGGFFIGIAALGLYAGVATLCDLAEGLGWQRGMRLAAITVAASAATLVNPYGLGMWETVVHALRNPYTRSVVTDWQPLIYAMAAQWHSAYTGVLLYLAAIGLAVALGAAFAATPRAGDLPLVAIAAMMAGAAFLSVRNMALVAIATAGPLARHLALWRAQRKPAAAPATPRPANQVIVFAIAIALAVSGGLFSGRLKPDRNYPAGALAFMRAHGLHGNVLTEFGWGEYLIWHAAGVDKVFIDGRYDTVYPLSVIRGYLEFYFDRPGADAVLKSYPHDFILLSPVAPASRLMERRKDWKLLYHDKASLLFGRAGAPSAAIPGLPVAGVARPGGCFP